MQAPNDGGCPSSEMVLRRSAFFSRSSALGAIFHNAENEPLANKEQDEEQADTRDKERLAR